PLVAAVVAWRVRAGNAPLAVEVAEAVRGPLEIEWSAVGYVESRSASVSAPSVGRVERVLVNEGDRVKSGQLLAVLAQDAESAALAAASAGVEIAAAQGAAGRALLGEAEAAQTSRERRAEADVATARTREAQAEAALRRARDARRAAVEAAQAELSAAQFRLQDVQRPARPEEIARADADVEAAQAALSLVRSELTRIEELEAAGAASRRDVDSAREAQTRATASLSAARQAAALARQGARADQIEAARAKVAACRAHLKVAEADLAGLAVEQQQIAEARSTRIAAQAGLSEVIAARGRVVATRSDLTAAETRIRQGRALAAQSGAHLRDRRIVAPFAGLVGRRLADPGDMASPGAPLFSIVEEDRTWVVAEVDEQDLAPVLQGRPVVVTAPAYVGREFAGRIEMIGGEAVPQTEVRTGARIVRVRVSLDGLPANQRALLKPGMEVHVRGRTVVVERALLVPSDAVAPSGSDTVVWVLDGESVRSRKVATGYAGVKQTEIRSGLRPGERVVVSGKESLVDGARARVAATRP
ncbi:MAG: efflux RND transporter periplasmic adaptor subunit, partial [Armatimonadetes bacterium]|nr:efflux RND transporter periplasmic adaptor subunit [Armatimonadota bacterium]